MSLVLFFVCIDEDPCLFIEGGVGGGFFQDRKDIVGFNVRKPWSFDRCQREVPRLLQIATIGRGVE